MILFYDLVLGALILLVVAGALWFISNIVMYLIKRSGGNQIGFYNLAEKWLSLFWVRTTQLTDYGREPAWKRDEVCGG